MPDEGACAAIAAKMDDAQRRVVRQVARRVRRQLAAGKRPSTDEVKILVDALLDG